MKDRLTRDNSPLRGAGMHFCMALLLAPRLAAPGRSGQTPHSSFDAFSSREPAATLLENAYGERREWD
jgi:hypothetical protein